MKLSKALKTKNKLAGEVAQAQRLITENNVIEGANKPQHDVIKLYAGLTDTQDKLAALKAKISVANAPISGKIFAMSEAKARIAFLRGLSTKNGSFMSDGSYRRDAVTIDYKATITSEAVESNVAALHAQIEKLQDEIDEFNAKTDI